jgi:hypothetical protein
MLLLCIALAGVGVAAYLSGDELLISIVTLLLLPILQATQNRDGAALQAKLDELIKTNADARDALLDSKTAARRRSSGYAPRRQRLPRQGFGQPNAANHIFELQDDTAALEKPPFRRSW